MQVVLAAIWYAMEQNEPSLPFVIRLDVAENTKEAIGEALLQWARENAVEDDGIDQANDCDCAFSAHPYFGDEGYQIEYPRSDDILFACVEGG